MNRSYSMVILFCISLYNLIFEGCDPSYDDYIIFFNKSQYPIGVQIENTCGDSIKNVHARPMMVKANEKRKYYYWFPMNMVLNCKNKTILLYSYQVNTDSLVEIKSPILVKNLLFTSERFDSLNKYFEYP